jgi:hypothetical protein
LLGAEKAFLVTVLFPSYMLVASALCFVWAPSLVLTQSFLAGLTGGVLVAIEFGALPHLAFSREYRGMVGSSEIGGRLLGFMLLLVGVGLLQYAIGRTIPGFLVMAAVLVGILPLIHRRTRSTARVTFESMSEQERTPAGKERSVSTGKPLREGLWRVKRELKSLMVMYLLFVVFAAVISSRCISKSAQRVSAPGVSESHR